MMHSLRAEQYHVQYMCWVMSSRQQVCKRQVALCFSNSCRERKYLNVLYLGYLCLKWFHPGGNYCILGSSCGLLSTYQLIHDDLLAAVCLAVQYYFRWPYTSASDIGLTFVIIHKCLLYCELDKGKQNTLPDKTRFIIQSPHHWLLSIVCVFFPMLNREMKQLNRCTVVVVISGEPIVVLRLVRSWVESGFTCNVM